MVSKMSSVLVQTDKGCYKGVGANSSARKSVIPLPIRFSMAAHTNPFDHMNQESAYKETLVNSDSEDEVLLEHDRSQ